MSHPGRRRGLAAHARSTVELLGLGRFRHPTRADFEVAARTLNRLPVAALEPRDISETVLHLVADSGRYITGTAQVVDAGGQL